MRLLGLMPMLLLLLPSMASAGELRLHAWWQSGEYGQRGDYVPLRLVVETLGGRVGPSGEVSLASVGATLGGLYQEPGGTCFEVQGWPHASSPVYENHRSWILLDYLVASLHLTPGHDERLRTVTLKNGDRQVLVFRVGSIWRAAALGDLAWLRRLVAAGVPVDERDPGHHTPLHWAACEDHPRTVAWLLAQGADPNATDWDNATPLLGAAATRSARTVRLLLAHGARLDLQARDQNGQPGRTPMLAARGNAVRLLPGQASAPERQPAPPAPVRR